ncbi:hypothetical protein ON010_g10821 [Phytophthora cinnamomi]|nr:hypothetical protein ON010_g10821 [Phytophthora cinnamomi]
MQTLSVPVHVSADVPAGSDPSTSNELEEWAAETTSAWMKEVKTEWKQLQRRETLVRFRANKKQRSAHMRCERDRLEREVKQRLAALHTTSVEDPGETGGGTSVTVCRLALESEVLRTENVEMHQKLQQLKRLWSLVHEGVVDVNASPMKHLTDVNVYEASKASVWVSYRPENKHGWRVHFPNGEPSFYFHPLTRPEFDAIYKASLDVFARMPQLLHPVGTLFGWTVYQDPLTRSPLDNSLVAHTKLSMWVGFSLEEVDALVLNSSLTWMPLIVVPLGWSDKQCDAVSVEVLQEFEKDAYIMVCNIPGKTHLRYLQVIGRQPHVEVALRCLIDWIPTARQTDCACWHVPPGSVIEDGKISQPDWLDYL